MIRRILVPIDVSMYGEQAVPVATAIARRCGAALDLALAEGPRAEQAAVGGSGMGRSGALPGVLPADERVEPVRELRRAYLGAVSQQVRAVNPGLEVQAELLEGAPVDALVERAGLNVDLIVMRAHGRGLTRIMLGSVSDRLVREVSIPVVLVKPEAPRATLDAGVRPQFRRILVPLDGSASAESVLEPVLDVVGTDRGEVRCTLLQVQPPMLMVPMMTSLPAAAYPVPAQGSGSDATSGDYLEEVAQRLRADGLRVDWRIVVHTHTSRAILDLAEELAADLIAVATHGHSGIRRFVIGSVADEVLRGAAKTVLMFRAPRALSSTAGSPRVVSRKDAVSATAGGASGRRPTRGGISIYPSAAVRSALMELYDAKLEEWTVPFEDIDVHTRYGRTHDIAAGLGAHHRSRSRRWL